MFLNAGRNLLSDDMYYQQEEMRQLSVFLNERICQMKKEYTGKKKVVLVFCLCMGTLAVILLVTILGQVLKHSGREEQAFLVSLAGLFIVISWIIPCISELFSEIYSLFEL